MTACKVCLLFHISDDVQESFLMMCSKRLVLVSYLCEEDEGCRESLFQCFEFQLFSLAFLWVVVVSCLL